MMIARNLERSPRRGGALVMTLTALVAVSTLSMVMVEMAGSAQDEQRRATEMVHAQYVAEAAANRSVALVRSGETGALGNSETMIEHGNSVYWVDSAVNGDGDVRTLTATAMDDRTTARIEVTLMSTPDSLWRFAAFGKDGLHMDSNARVDSYDSAAGSYASQAVNSSGTNQFANDEGNIGSNDDITMDQNSQVWGSAACGSDDTTTVLGNAVVTGSTQPADVDIDLPPLVVPSFPSLGALTVNGTLNLAAGNYQYTNLTLRAGAVVNVSGPATIVITNFLMRSGSLFKIDPTNGPVTVYVIDDFLLSSNAQMYATTFDPDKLSLNLLSDNVIDPDIVVDLDTVDFDSNTKIYGTLYAPNAHIAVDSNLELFGAMMARSIDLDSNARIHYDENLARVRQDGPPIWSPVAWRTLPPIARGTAD